jgi:hypothetical protein
MKRTGTTVLHAATEHKASIDKY